MRHSIWTTLLACTLAFGQVLFQVSALAVSPESLDSAQSASLGYSPGLDDRDVNAPPFVLPIPANASGPTRRTIQDGTAVGETAQADPYANWSKIAYQGVVDGNWDVFVAQADGSLAINLSNHPSTDENPDIRPDLSRVVFDSNRSDHWQIYSVGMDGSSLVNLSNTVYDEYDAEWSPDGTKIVYVSEKKGNPDISITDLVTGIKTVCTAHWLEDLYPTWSPDGKTIYWVQTWQRGFYTELELHAMDADCNNQRRIFGEGFFYPLMGPLYISPDGTRLLINYDDSNDGFVEPHIWNLSGSTSALQEYRNDSDLIVGAWSPDGKGFVYNQLLYFSSDTTRPQSYTVRRLFPDQFEYEDRYVTLDLGRDAVVHDWVTMDRWAPRTVLSPLPQFSRQTALKLSWFGEDVGPAGINRYELEMRLPGKQDWAAWDLDQTGTSMWYIPWPGMAGETLHFRARAVDNASVVEPWRSDGSGIAQTTLYAAQIHGRITDNRNFGLERIALAVSPAALATATSTANGEYAIYSKDFNTYSLTNSGTGAFPASSVNLNSGDVFFNRYLAPDGNLLQNGGFENGLDSWTLAGGPGMASVSTYAHSGSAALKLGVDCPDPCLVTVKEPYPSEHFTVGPDGTTHFIIVQGENTSTTIQHIFRSSDGTWSEPEVIATVAGSPGYFSCQFEADGNGTLHLKWHLEGTTYYTQKAIGGSWSVPALVVGGAYAHMSLRKDGTVFFLYLSGNKLYFRQRAVAGTWSGPQVLLEMSGSFFLKYGILATEDGNVHVVYSNSDYYTGSHVFHRIRNTSGAWSEPQVVFGRYALEYPLNVDVELFAGPNNGVYGYFGRSYGLSLYMPETGWSTPTPYWGEMVSDSYGRLHTVTPYGTVFAITYQARGLEGWEPFPQIGAFGNLFAFTAGAQDELHVVQSKDNKHPYQARKTADASAVQSLEQQVTIPADMHQPTLAFQYRGSVIGYPDGAALEAVVIDGVEETVVYHARGTAGWQLAWVDLTPWQGRTVTVAFRLVQPQGAYLGQAFLDEVTLSSWLTPVVNGVSPNRLELRWEGQKVILNGENFLPGAQVFFGDLRSGSVNYINNEQLEVTIPGGLGSGVHNISAVNPGSQRYCLSGGLHLGTYLYLPTLKR